MERAFTTSSINQTLLNDTQIVVIIDERAFNGGRQNSRKKEMILQRIRPKSN